jgi:peptidylprolyl isomerase
MKFRFYASLALGVSLASVPAMAKNAPPVPAKIYPTVIDTNPSHDAQDVLFLDLSNGGRVTIRLMPAWAPNHVNRIKALVAQHFYDGVIFHRVIDGFMAQTGDPTGTGEGGSQLPNLKAEFNPMPHVRGTVSMARTNDPDSANSQFFIVFYPRFALDRKYTVFGRVIAGMDVVDRIERGEPPANPTKIVHAYLASEGLRAPTPVAVPTPAITADQLNNSKSN